MSRRCRAKQKVARKRRIAKLKADVFAIIGHACFNCGSGDDLEVDHIGPRSWDLKTVNQETRWKTYLAEAREGLLCCLCARCNGMDGWFRSQGVKPGGMADPEVPF